MIYVLIAVVVLLLIIGIGILLLGKKIDDLGSNEKFKD